MTIRETLTNILRLPSDARAVVEMARENAEKQKETYALESVLLRKVESLERQLDDARNEVGPQLALIEELRRQLRVGTERIRELETQAERHRGELEESLRDARETLIQRDEWASKCGRLGAALNLANERLDQLTSLAAIADLWKPLTLELWNSIRPSAWVLLKASDGERLARRRGNASGLPNCMRDGVVFTHLIHEEEPTR